MKKKYYLILLIVFSQFISIAQQTNPAPCGTVGFDWRTSAGVPTGGLFTDCPNTDYQLKANKNFNSGESIAPGFNIVISSGSMNITKIEISQGGGAYQNIGTITNIAYASPNYEYKVRITGTVITAPVSINIVNHASGSVITSATYSAGVVITIPSGSINGIATFSGSGVSNYQLNYPSIGKTDYIGNGYGVFNPSIAGNGTHTITYTWNNGNSDCGSATKIVTVSGCVSTPAPCLTGPTPNATITPQDSTTFCQGGSVNLNAPIDSSYTYQWYNNNQLISEATTHTWKASATGAYTVKISNGSCEAISAPIQVKVNPLPLASIFPSGNLVSICEGTSITLKASGGTKYKWNSGETTSEVLVNTSGAHYVNVYNENGCKSNAGLDISIKNNPKVSIENIKAVVFKNEHTLPLNGYPKGGAFYGEGVVKDSFYVKNISLGKKKIDYKYIDTNGCIGEASTSTIVVDSVGNICNSIKYDTILINKTKYDTVTIINKVTEYDTVKVNTYDTITVKNNVYDTVIINKTKYDTITITNSVTKYDTLKVTKYDTITLTNNVTKYDTVKVNTYDTITITNNVTKYDTVKVNTYDTITVTNSVTKYDTVIVKTNVFDTVKVNTYDTITVTKNVTKYDTVIVNKTKYDTITVTNNVTKYDTVIVNKTQYDTITVTDTVNILKINFKLTTGLKANQMTSMSIYPNPTTDVLHIEIEDAKALDGYRYRILDALGKEVYNELVKNVITEIPLKSLGAAGMYQLEVLDANKTSIQTNKIVLQ